MAEEKTNTKKVKTGKKGKRRGGVNLPSKRTINLAGIGVKRIDPRLAIPGILIILCGAVLIGKYLVSDRLTEMSRAQAEAQQVQSELDALYDEMGSYGDLMDRYAHYTYSGMTSEELNRIERTKVVELIQRVIVPQAVIGSWSVRGNELTINITGKTLQEINLIVQSLEKEVIVDFCKVTTAVMNENTTLVNQMDQAAAAEQAQNESGADEGFIGSLSDVADDLAENREWIESGEYENVVTEENGEQPENPETTEVDLANAPVNANLVVYLINAEYPPKGDSIQETEEGAQTEGELATEEPEEPQTEEEASEE